MSYISHLEKLVREINKEGGTTMVNIKKSLASAVTATDPTWLKKEEIGGSQLPCAPRAVRVNMRPTGAAYTVDSNEYQTVVSWPYGMSVVRPIPTVTSVIPSVKK
eukprot:sb/3478016/